MHWFPNKLPITRLYFSRVEEARLSFLTFDTTGYDRDFQNVCSKKDKFGLEYALIREGFSTAVVQADCRGPRRNRPPQSSRLEKVAVSIISFNWLFRPQFDLDLDSP